MTQILTYVVKIMIFQKVLVVAHYPSKSY